MTHYTRVACVAVAVAVLTYCLAQASAQAFASADAARDLAYALDRMGLDAIAAADPQEPGRFVAALYIPGSQLLVVSARHPSTDAVAHRIASRQYREVYLDLQGTPTTQGKFFVQDSQADGILSALPGSGGIDVLYEDGTQQTLFNGDVEGQDLTRAEYDKKLISADARYAHLLRLLAAAIDEAPTGQGVGAP